MNNPNKSVRKAGRVWPQKIYKWFVCCECVAYETLPSILWDVFLQLHLFASYCQIFVERARLPQKTLSDPKFCSLLWIVQQKWKKSLKTCVLMIKNTLKCIIDITESIVECICWKKSAMWWCCGKTDRKNPIEPSSVLVRKKYNLALVKHSR